jgi:hypothetical protein
MTMFVIASAMPAGRQEGMSVAIFTMLAMVYF